MLKKLKQKTKEIKNANNTVLEPKKNLMIEIVAAICVAVFLVTIYFFTGSWKCLLCAIIAPTLMTVFSLHAFFKEKKQDKNSEIDKQKFLSGTKYRQSEWKNAYYQYKENHTFEPISKNGMKYDLKRRYRKKDFGYIRIGIFFIIGSILILFIPMTEMKDKVAAIFGILFGGVIFSIGLHGLTSGPVQKFFKQQANLTEIEKSYVKGKMLSFGNNGINLGNSYTIIYNSENVFAVDNHNIRDMTRKMVRVKKYENSTYSGHEYRYYVSLIYTALDGKTKTVDVRLDEFQCEMMIAEFNRHFYPGRKYDSTTSETTENTVSPP